jgi:hypothetical protein
MCRAVRKETKMPGPRVTKLLESLLDQHGLIGAIEAVEDGRPFTRERQIALLAGIRDAHKKNLARTKAAHRREQERPTPHYDYKAKNPSSTEKITSFDWERYRREQAELAKERGRQRALADEMIDAGYRSLAKVHHRDVGGAAENMARLTRARDQLKKNAR